MTDTIIPVWRAMTPELKAELIAFWERNRALGDAEEASKRADQAVCIGRDADSQIWGVGTAFLGILSTLGQPTYFYRQFFAESVRGQKRTIPFIRRAVEVMERYNASLPKPEAVGVLFELQNHALSGHYQRVYEPDADATFIGWSPRGMQLRVIYFKDARLLLPPPQRKPAGPAGPAAGGTQQP